MAKNSEDRQPQNEEETPVEEELNEEDLEDVSGGIIIVSGKNKFDKVHEQANIFTNKGNISSLNPQPLPPKEFNSGGH